MRIGGRVALAPDAAEWRLHLRQGLNQRTRTREAAAAHAGAAMIGLLQPERELVDLVWIGDHQLVQIIAVRREFLGLIRIRRDAPQWCRRAFEPKPVRADHRKAAQPVTELGGNAAANDPAKREAGKAQFGLAGQDPVDAGDDDRSESLGSPRLRRRCRLTKAGQIGRQHMKMPGQRQHVADPMGPRAVAAMQQDERPAAAPAVPHQVPIAARRLQTLRLARDPFDECLCCLADHRHSTPRANLPRADTRFGRARL